MVKASKKSSRKASAATAAKSRRRRGQQYPVLPRAPRGIDAVWIPDEDFEDYKVILIGKTVRITDYVPLSHFDSK